MAGRPVARNRGLDSSTAPWVAILDGDDYFLPNRMKALLDASEGADFVADDQVQIKEEGGDAEFLIGHSTTMTIDLATFVTENLSNGPRLRKEFGFLKPIMRRSFLDSHQLRYDEQLRLGEDFALYTRALAAGAIFRVVPARTYASIVRSEFESAVIIRRWIWSACATAADLWDNCRVSQAGRGRCFGCTMKPSMHVSSGSTSSMRSNAGT